MKGNKLIHKFSSELHTTPTQGRDRESFFNDEYTAYKVTHFVHRDVNYLPKEVLILELKKRLIEMVLRSDDHFILTEEQCIFTGDDKLNMIIKIKKV